MKTHIIPHNIMDVEFKLFGFMNVKQFVYVATGAVLSYIMYNLVASGSVPAVIGWPLIVVFAGLGIAFGLVPFRGRMLDQWLLNYVSAISSPTKRAWMKKGITPDAIPASIPVEQLKPAQITIGRQFTVSEIIGAMNIPIPELSIQPVEGQQAVAPETNVIKATPGITSEASPVTDSTKAAPPQTVEPNVKTTATYQQFQGEMYKAMTQPTQVPQPPQTLSASNTPVTPTPVK